MSTCVSCSSYYRINAFHQDLYNCQDCTGIIIEEYEDDTDISNLINPSGKIQAVYNEEDANDTD